MEEGKQLLTLFFLLVCSHSVLGSVDEQSSRGSLEQATCSCSNEYLCMPLSVAQQLNSSLPHVILYEQKKLSFKLFAFVLPSNSSEYSKFDWEHLTTVAVVNFDDPIFTCYAHSYGVRVVKLANIPKSSLANATARALWISQETNEVVQSFMDGINVDFEDTIDEGSPEQLGYTQLIAELTPAMHETVPDSEVSVGVAWTAAGADGRYYDYAGLGAAADVLFIMAYDEQSQIWDPPCSARGNSYLSKAVQGIDEYLALGIQSQKLVLGLPWYSYRYECLQLLENGTCLIEEVPFRGCNCSDAAGSQLPYDSVVDIAAEHKAIIKMDNASKTPYFTIQEGNAFLQFWLDDPYSLSQKVLVAALRNLTGVGMWTANFLDSSDTAEAQQQRLDMWHAMTNPLDRLL